MEEAPGRGAQASPSDTAGYAYRVQSTETEYTFRSDGTGRKTFTAHLRVQTEAGVSALGQLTFPYTAAFEDPEIEYARVVKPDGEVVRADDSDVHDRSLPAGTATPVYSDARALHVAVPRLRPGDRLEVRLSVEFVEPVVPGQFFMEDVFWRGVPVEEEVIRVVVPADRRVRVGGAGDDPTVEDGDGARVYEWTNSVEEPDDGGHGLGGQASPLTRREPDVMVSSFGSWREVGDWYDSLTSSALETDGRIESLADSLVEGLGSEREQARALYRYVAREIRYVAVELGAGRYEPHRALETLENGYGDCKDQHVLLASLLAARGIESRPALIHSARESLDRDVPSPNQFDHLVSVVEIEGEELWLDATAGVAPFGHLPGHLRDKLALAVEGDRGGELVRAPAEPGVENLERFALQGRVTEAGALEAEGELVARGDPAIVLRAILRRVPPRSWETLVARMLREMEVSGDVSDVEVSRLEDVSRPVAVSFDLAAEGWLDTASVEAEVRPPLPELQLPEASGEKVRLGGPVSYSYRVSIAVPAVRRSTSPGSVGLDRPWARYESSYAVRGDSLVAEKNVTVTEPVISSGQVSGYEDFVESIRRDEDVRFRLSLGAPSPDAQPADGRGADPTNDGEEDPDVLARLADHQLRTGNPSEAEKLARRALELEPEHDEAWHVLGLALLEMQRNEEAEEAFRKHVEVVPDHGQAWNDLGLVLRRQGKYSEAEEAFRRQIEVEPEHRYAYANLGLALWNQGRKEEAEEAFRRDLELDPDDPRTTGNLGVLLLQLDRPGEAEEWLRKAIELNDAGRRELKLRLVEALQAQGRRDEAREILEEVAPGVVNGGASGADSTGDGPERADDRDGAAEGRVLSSTAERLQELRALLEENRHSQLASTLYELVLRKDRVRRRPDALGRVLMNVADPGRLIDALRSADGDDGRRSVYAQAAASLSLYTGRLEEALEAARRATELDPDDPSGWVLLGRAEYLNVNHTRALFAYRRARELDPGVFDGNPEDREIWRELEGGGS